MAQPVAALKPSNIVSQEAHQVVTTGVVTILTYTVPAGKLFRLEMATAFLPTATPPTVQLQLQRGGNTTAINSGTLSSLLTSGGWFLAGDVLRWQATAGGAASTVDATLSGEEYDSV